MEFLNACISFDIGPINIKLENVANLNVLFLVMWASCCLSHNKGIREENDLSKTFFGGVGKGEARGVGMTILVKYILGHLQCTIRGFRFNTSLSIAYF